MTTRTLTVREHVRGYPSNAVKRATTERLRAEVEHIRTECALAEWASWFLSLTKAELLGGE